jgi:hypothetical protein
VAHQAVQELQMALVEQLILVAVLVVLLYLEVVKMVALVL